MGKIYFNLYALFSVVPGAAIILSLEATGVVPSGVDVMVGCGVALAIDLLIRLSKDEDMSIVDPETGGHIMFIPIWALGALGLFFSFSATTGMHPVLVLGLCFGVILFFLAMLMLWKSLTDTGGTAGSRSGSKRALQETDPLAEFQDFPDPWASDGEDDEDSGGALEEISHEKPRKKRKLRKLKNPQAPQGIQPLAASPPPPPPQAAVPPPFPGEQGVKKRCSNCGGAIVVNTPKRPIVISCIYCRKKFRLTK